VNRVCCSFFYCSAVESLIWETRGFLPLLLTSWWCSWCVSSTRQFLSQSNYFVYFPQQFRVSDGCSKERATVHESSVTHTCEDTIPFAGNYSQWHHVNSSSQVTDFVGVRYEFKCESNHFRITPFLSLLFPSFHPAVSSLFLFFSFRVEYFDKWFRPLALLNDFIFLLFQITPPLRLSFLVERPIV